MNRRYPFHSVLFAIITASSSLSIQPAAFAAHPPKQDARGEQRADHTRKCKKYVREHHGHPAKGTDVVKVVYVDCVDKR